MVKKKNMVGEIECMLCYKARVVFLADASTTMRFGDEDLTAVLEAVVDEGTYKCGEPLPEPADLPRRLRGHLQKLAVRLKLDCASPMERWYYELSDPSCPDRCYYCGELGCDPPANRGDPARPVGCRMVFPRCDECMIKGLDIATWGERFDEGRRKRQQRREARAALDQNKRPRSTGSGSGRADVDQVTDDDMDVDDDQEEQKQEGEGEQHSSESEPEEPERRDESVSDRYRNLFGEDDSSSEDGEDDVSSEDDEQSLTDERYQEIMDLVRQEP
jgi:hypothetical protein